MPRWPEPRPPLALPRLPVPTGAAAPWQGSPYEGADDEVIWVVGTTPAQHAALVAGGGAELTMARDRRLLRLTLHPKDGSPAQSFRHPIPAGRAELERLALLGAQDWWHVVSAQPSPVWAVELRNTLDLSGLLGGM